MSKRASIYSIAEEVGVSPSTVAKIISGRSRGRPGNREAVLEAAARLGYEPNLMAQNLSRGASKSIGVFVRDVGDGYWAEVLRGIEEGAS